MDYQITDFRLAGYLNLHGAILLRSIPGTKDDVVFVFAHQTKDGQDIQDLIMQYPVSPECRYDAACRAMMEVVRVFKTRRS